MRHALSSSFDAWEFSEDVIEPLHQASRDRSLVRVTLRDTCEPHELVGLVERVAATAAFAVIAGQEVPIPAIRAVDVGSLVKPEDLEDCRVGRARSRYRGRRGCA